MALRKKELLQIFDSAAAPFSWLGRKPIHLRLFLLLLFLLRFIAFIDSKQSGEIRLIGQCVAVFALGGVVFRIGGLFLSEQLGIFGS